MGKDLSVEEVARFFEKSSKVSRHGFTTIICSGLAAAKRRAFMVHNYDNIILEELGWFLENPNKRWILSAAIADYIKTFKPIKNPTLNKVLK